MKDINACPIMNILIHICERYYVERYLGENDEKRIITACSTRNIYQDTKFLPRIKCACWTRICFCAYTDHHLHLSVVFNICKLIPPTSIIRLIILSSHFLTSKMFQLIGQFEMCFQILLSCLVWLLFNDWTFVGFSLPEILLWEKYPNVYLTTISRD